MTTLVGDICMRVATHMTSESADLSLGIRIIRARAFLSQAPGQQLWILLESITCV